MRPTRSRLVAHPPPAGRQRPKRRTRPYPSFTPSGQAAASTPITPFATRRPARSSLRSSAPHSLSLLRAGRYRHSSVAQPLVSTVPPATPATTPNGPHTPAHRTAGHGAGSRLLPPHHPPAAGARAAPPTSPRRHSRNSPNAHRPRPGSAPKGAPVPTPRPDARGQPAQKKHRPTPRLKLLTRYPTRCPSGVQSALRPHQSTRCPSGACPLGSSPNPRDMLRFALHCLGFRRPKKAAPPS